MQTGSVQFCHFATQSYIYHTQYMPLTHANDIQTVWNDGTRVQNQWKTHPVTRLQMLSSMMWHTTF